MTSSALGAASRMDVRNRSREARNLGGTRARYSSTVLGGEAPRRLIPLEHVRACLRIPRSRQGGPARWIEAGGRPRDRASAVHKVLKGPRESSSVEPIAVSLRDVESALPIVREVAVRTPTVPFADAHGGEVLLKLESLQRLGAFKVRGTWNRLASLSGSERRRGVTTISSGNHGLSLAWSARRLGLPCTVCVPLGASPGKVRSIRDLGARVRRLPRAELVRTHVEERWRSWPETFIHPFAHPATIAGQGTIGWELAEDAPDVRTVLVPVGGGGLASGIATAVKGRLPHVRVLGVQAEGAAPLPEALRTGGSARVEVPRTIADGIGIGLILPSMVGILRRALDGCLLVSDEEILEAMGDLAREAKVVAEPAGAAAFAAWRRHRADLRPPVAVVISGGNVDAPVLARALRASGPRSVRTPSGSSGRRRRSGSGRP